MVINKRGSVLRKPLKPNSRANSGHIVALFQHYLLLETSWILQLWFVRFHSTLLCFSINPQESVNELIKCSDNDKKSRSLRHRSTLIFMTSCSATPGRFLHSLLCFYLEKINESFSSSFPLSEQNWNWDFSKVFQGISTEISSKDYDDV